MEFKRLSDVDIVAEPTETANVLIEENGVIKKAPKTAVGGSGSEVVTILWDADNDSVTLSDNTYKVLKENFIDNFIGANILAYRKESNMIEGTWIQYVHDNVNCIRVVTGSAWCFDIFPDNTLGFYGWID